MSDKLEKKLSVGILVILILLFCLSMTTFALIYASLVLEDNTIESGFIAINLNDGNPIITDGEFQFEPGMTVEKTFTLQNTSPCSVWYRFYFVIKEDEAIGNMQDVLEVTIKDGDIVLYNGTMAELKKSNFMSAPSNEIPLEENEPPHVFTMLFHLPSDVGNEMQNASLPFDFVADAVQTKNNPNRLFHD